MSKESKEPKNYGEYGYAGDEEIVISVAEFMKLKMAVNQAISNGVTVDRPQVLKWVEKGTGKEVKFSMKLAKEGKIEQSTDVAATRSDENVKVSYDNNLFPHIFDANEAIMGIHFRQVELGVAKTEEEIKKYSEERKAKGQMKIQDDDEVADAEEVKAEPKADKAPMGVVRDEPETEEDSDKQ